MLSPLSLHLFYSLCRSLCFWVSTLCCGFVRHIVCNRNCIWSLHWVGWRLFGIQKRKAPQKTRRTKTNWRKKLKRMKRRQKQIRQIKMTLKHETVKLRPRYWTNAAARTFRWLKKVIKRKRIYWFGTFPWNKWHEQRESDWDRHGVAAEEKCRETVQWSESLWYTTYRMCNWICIECTSWKKTAFFFTFCFASSLRWHTFFSLSETMLMSNENTLYELFWHLIFAKNMLKLSERKGVKEREKSAIVVFATTRILSACAEGNFCRTEEQQ